MPNQKKKRSAKESEAQRKRTAKNKISLIEKEMAKISGKNDKQVKHLEHILNTQYKCVSK